MYGYFEYASISTSQLLPEKLMAWSTCTRLHSFSGSIQGWLATFDGLFWCSAQASDGGMSFQPRPSETDEPHPSATDEPRPSATDEPRPSATDEPHPSATDEPRPSATDEPRPSATDEPRPSATDEPRPSATDHLKLMNLVHLQLMNLVHLKLRQFQTYPDNLLYVQTPRISPELLSYQLLPGDRNVGLCL